MKTIIEPQREIPVAGEYDVLVLGAGPAGIGAAVSAARMGVKTLLIENGSDVGGVATIGLMSHWTGKTQGGIYQEILELTNDDESQRQTINPERLKTKLLEMLKDAGAEVLLYTMAVQPVMDGNTITGVICESKSGRQAYMGKIVIDSTGDGDIAARSGVPYIKGRETDGKMQPMTLMFKIAGVDTENAVFLGSFESTYQTERGELQQLAKEHLPHPAGHVLLYRSTLPGVVTVNMTNSISVDGCSNRDLTEATITCRKQMDIIVDFLREYVPGYQNCYIISSASLIGVRETRHFSGEYTLTEQDILDAKVFDDYIATRCHFNFDVHNISGASLDKTGLQFGFPQQRGYTISYRSILPQKIDNLLLAGRNISGTHMAHSSYRVMPICANVGQGAGIAAALCAKLNQTPRELDYAVIRKELDRLGIRP